MEGLASKIHEKMTAFCHKMAEKEQRGYAQAVWFEQNGKTQIEERIADVKFSEWFQKAQGLGYGIEDITVEPYISTYGEWYNRATYSVEIPIYGCYCADALKFPSNSEFPKAFIAPFIERERKEAREKREKEAAIKAEREKAENARKKQEEAERERREKEKADWITAHGSNFLKRAFGLGYDCQRKYITERVAMELPDFEVDFDDQIDWKSRSCPSEEALDEVEKLIGMGYSAKVIWLTSPPRKPKYDDPPFESCEAILIRNYLKKYDLIKIIETDE